MNRRGLFWTLLGLLTAPFVRADRPRPQAMDADVLGRAVTFYVARMMKAPERPRGELLLYGDPPTPEMAKLLESGDLIIRVSCNRPRVHKAGILSTWQPGGAS